MTNIKLNIIAVTICVRWFLCPSVELPKNVSDSHEIWWRGVAWAKEETVKFRGRSVYHNKKLELKELWTLRSDFLVYCIELLSILQVFMLLCPLQDKDTFVSVVK